MKHLSFFFLLATCFPVTAIGAEASSSRGTVTKESEPKLNYEIYKEFDMGADGLAGSLQMPSKRLAVPYQFNFCNGRENCGDPWVLEHTLQFDVTRYDPDDHPEGWTESMTLDGVDIQNTMDAEGNRHGVVSWHPINHWHPDQYLPGRMNGIITYKNESKEFDTPCDYEEPNCVPGKLCESITKRGQQHNWVDDELADFSVDFFQPVNEIHEEVVAHMDFQVKRVLRSEASACGPKP